MPAALIAARSLQFWAVALLVGGAGFALLFGRTSRHVVPVLRIAVLAAVLSGVAWFALVFVGIAGDATSLRDPDAWSAFAGAPFGPPWLLRLALLVVGLAALAIRDPRLFLALGTLLVLDQAWLGHAASAEGAGAAWQIAAYWLHGLAGSAWVGGLVILCVVVVDERRVPAECLALFSSLGLGLVVAILVSGLANAAARGVGPADLVQTDYGRILAIKLALVAAMLALAIYNRITAHHLVQRTGVPPTVWLETGLGLGVLVAAAVLGTTPPA